MTSFRDLARDGRRRLRSPHPAVVLRDLRLEDPLVLRRAVLLHGVEDLAALVVVDVEVRRGARLPLVVADLALVHLHAFLVMAAGRDGRGEFLDLLGAGRRGECEGNEEQGAHGDSSVYGTILRMIRGSRFYFWFFHPT